MNEKIFSLISIISKTERDQYLIPNFSPLGTCSLPSWVMDCGHIITGNCARRELKKLIQLRKKVDNFYQIATGETARDHVTPKSNTHGGMLHIHFFSRQRHLRICCPTLTIICRITQGRVIHCLVFCYNCLIDIPPFGFFPHVYPWFRHI